MIFGIKQELIFHKAAISCLGKSSRVISPPVSEQSWPIWANLIRELDLCQKGKQERKSH